MSSAPASDRGHQVVLGVLRAVDDHDALLVEQVGDRAGLAEVPAALLNAWRNL
jgi:hypothetical protein